MQCHEIHVRLKKVVQLHPAKIKKTKQNKQAEEAASFTGLITLHFA